MKSATNDCGSFEPPSAPAFAIVREGAVSLCDTCEDNMHLSNGLAWKIFITRQPETDTAEYHASHALSALRPCTPAPTRTPVPVAFNWGEVASSIVDQAIDWFVVAFRSVRLPDADADTLYVADALAHAEARVSGGLLAYYYSGLEAGNRGLAMCVWQTAQAARAASTLPLHLRASGLAKAMYASYQIELFSLKKPPGDRALAFAPYERPTT